MTELMWSTLGFVTTLTIITIADAVVQCSVAAK